MTAQEKINQLALAALRSAPPTAALPEPTTYMAPFEKPKSVAMVAAPKSAVAVAANPATDLVIQFASDAPVAPFKDEADPELRAQIEERDARISKQHSRRSLAVTLSVLGLLAAGGVWISQSPKAQAEVMALLPALKQSANDVKMLGSITQKYDKQLEKVAVQGDRIDEATRALGVDPATAAEGEDVHMQGEMEQMMGGEGQTTAERDQALQKKFGVVENLLGKKSEPVSTGAVTPQS